jgi:hypothetical protein
MTPVDTRRLNKAVQALLDDEWCGYCAIALEQSRLLVTVLGGR